MKVKISYETDTEFYVDIFSEDYIIIFSSEKLPCKCGDRIYMIHAFISYSSSLNIDLVSNCNYSKDNILKLMPSFWNDEDDEFTCLENCNINDILVSETDKEKIIDNIIKEIVDCTI